MLIRRRLAALTLVGALGALTLPLAMASSASAITPTPHPFCQTGYVWNGDECVPAPTGPTATTIYGLSPSYGWSGDTVTISGAHLSGATVTVNAQPAIATGSSDSSLTFTIPVINSTVVGPVSLPVTVSSSYGTASTSFTLSPSMRTTGYQEFNQSIDGTASSTVDVNRQAGTVTGHTEVVNNQFWLSLSVDVSCVWLDASGKVIGYTSPRTVTGSGIAFHYPSGQSKTALDWNDSIGPNPGVGPWIHSGQVVMVRDHLAELLDTLKNAFALGQTIKQVVTTLAPYMG